MKQKTIGLMFLAVSLCVLAVATPDALAKVHHAFVRPEFNSHLPGGRQLSLKEIAEAIRVGGGNKYFLGAVDALLRELSKEGISAAVSRDTLANFLLDVAVTEEPCSRFVGEDGTIGTVYFEDGGRTGPFRRTCYDHEMFLVVWGRPLMSTTCGQPVIAEPRPVPPTRATETLPPLLESREPPPTPPVIEGCVPLEPELIGKVAFLFEKRIDEWKRCNPHAKCDEDCLAWIGRERSIIRENQDNIDRVRKLTGQGPSTRFAALRGATMRPRVLLLEEIDVFCDNSRGQPIFYQLKTRKKKVVVSTGLWW